MDGLNTKQRQAVEAGKGPILIIAGPGTGKTKTLTSRITFLLEARRAKPEEIIALTFTNRAAREMHDRLQYELGSAKLPKIATFHALGQELLQRHKQNTKLAEARELQDIIRSLPRPKELKGVSARELALQISRAKTSLQPAPDDSTRQLLASYEQTLQEQNLHDFDDLLTKTYQLLQADKINRPNYEHVLVDEFQDTSQLQYEILKLLSSNRNIFAIGDPKQSIYGFRGAGAEMFGQLRSDFPNTQEVDLTINYRSRPQIVALANAIFPTAPQLTAHAAEPGNIQIVETLNEYSEAAYIINRIEQGIGGSDMLKASGDILVHEPRDYAVLYRTHRAARTLQKAFSESGIPHQIAGEGSPYEKPEIAAIIAVMRHTYQPDQVPTEALLQLPSFPKHSPAQLNALLVKLSEQKRKSVCDLATNIAAIFGLSPGQELQQFASMLVQFGACDSGLGAALRHIDEIAQNEFYDPSVNAVTLFTIHAAKGLEFAHVFLIAAEEGILPKIDKSQTNLAEERRLFYVAVTRAKENLEILHARTRTAQPTNLSRFAADLPSLILPRAIDPDLPTLEKRLQKRRHQRAQTSLFNI